MYQRLSLFPIDDLKNLFKISPLGRIGRLPQVAGNYLERFCLAGRHEFYQGLQHGQVPTVTCGFGRMVGRSGIDDRNINEEIGHAHLWDTLEALLGQGVHDRHFEVAVR